MNHHKHPHQKLLLLSHCNWIFQKKIYLGGISEWISEQSDTESLCYLKWLRHHSWSTNAHDILYASLYLPVLMQLGGDNAWPMLTVTLNWGNTKAVCKSVIFPCLRKNIHFKSDYFHQSPSSYALCFALPEDKFINQNLHLD